MFIRLATDIIFVLPPVKKSRSHLRSLAEELGDDATYVQKGLQGPWWWSSGQHARLLLRRSEFESHWRLQFFCKIIIEKNENKQKDAGVGPFFKKGITISLHESKHRIFLS